MKTVTVKQPIQIIIPESVISVKKIIEELNTQETELKQLHSMIIK